MNIKITHNWLLDFIDTDADPYEIQKYLSLCGPSIETVEKTADDYIYDIEITSNRIDSASVFGIALECQAILPMFGKKAKLRFNPLEKYRFNSINNIETNKLSLQIKIQSPDLCSRFTAIVVDNVKTQPAPEYMQKRLLAVGIKSINNVVDITNYLMIAFGQPSHVFDYDSIKDKAMIMRESKKGEKVKTLDGIEVTLPGGDIVMEDGAGNLFDLCGIMGGLDSSFTPETKRVIFFVQTYNKQKIRKTSMLTGQRTVAATFFEKGLDEERVEPTLVYGLELLKQLAQAKIASPLYDIYPRKYQSKTITLDQEYIDRIIGIKIKKETIISILNALGFAVTGQYKVTIPSFRRYDVDIKEDIIEEISRIYGYHNIPSNVQAMVYVKQPPAMEQLFVFQHKIKLFLKHLGLNEVLNYSMISEAMLVNNGFDPKEHLYLSNVLSEDIKFLRTSLMPSLIKNIKDNSGRSDKLKLFELAKIYPRRKADLPDEQYKITIATTTNIQDLKGIIEALFKELNINNYYFYINDNQLFHPKIQGRIQIGETAIGIFGQLKNEYQEKNQLETAIYLAEIDFAALVKESKIIPKYKPLHPYATIKLDKTIDVKGKTTFTDLKKSVFAKSKLLQKIEVISSYKNKLTLRFYFSSSERNLTEEEAKNELKIVLKVID